MAFEKVNPSHPDKVADRIAGALVDYCYAQDGTPRCAWEVLTGHGTTTIIGETSVRVPDEEVKAIVERILGENQRVILIEVPQDELLADNQKHGIKAADNGIFRGVPVTDEQKVLTAIAASIYGHIPYDGKYILHSGYGSDLTICQSHMVKSEEAKLKVFIEENYYIPNEHIVINPLGEWIGGTDTDSGATNRKLGSDMGDAVTGGGLMGKDLSKADVTLNIMCHIEAQRTKQVVTASCAIGDEGVEFYYEDGHIMALDFSECVERAWLYILTDCDGSFEKFAEWGLIRPKLY